MPRTQLATVTPLHGEPAPVIPLRRGTRLRPRSAKQAAVYRDHRVPLVKELLTVRPWCEIRWDSECQGWAVQVHEPRKRSQGADICDPAECVTTCRHCHRQVHGNPAEAARRGWLRPGKAVRGGGGSDAA